MTDKILATALYPHPPIIIPEVGRSDIRNAETTINAVRKLSSKIVSLNPQTIVFITPHSIFNPQFFSVYTDEKLEGNFANFGAPHAKVSFDNDIEFVRNLENNSKNIFNRLNKIPSGTSLDHGTLVPLYYLDKAGYQGKIMVINYCALGPEEHVFFGEKIRETAFNLDRDIVFVASGDLSHRLKPGAPAGYNPEAHVFDDLVVDSISKGNLEAMLDVDLEMRRTAGECAFNSLMVALGVTLKTPKNNEIYSYEAPFGVGYAVATL